MIMRNRSEGILHLVSALFLVAASVSVCSKTPIIDATPPPDEWETYWNRWYEYQVQYPPSSYLVETIGGASTTIYLNPEGVPSFTRSNRFVLISSRHSYDGCLDEDTGSQRLSYRIGDLEFMREDGSSASSSMQVQWQSFTTSRDGVCITLTYASRGGNPDLQLSSLNAFGDSNEYRYFLELLRSFQWS
jgi:hypothetical protein